MHIRTLLIGMLPLLAAALTGCEKHRPEPAAPETVSYADDVAPILQEHCAECHLPGLPGAEATGFLVDTYASVMQGSQYGPAIDPGSARTSSLYILLTGEDKLTVTMPHGKAPLSAEQIEKIGSWIDQGALEN